MKKTKHHVSDGEPKDKTPVETKEQFEVVDGQPPIDSIKDEAPMPAEIENQELREIESTEVTPGTEQEMSVDPDKEVMIKKPEQHDPWWKRKKIIIPIISFFVLIIVMLAIPMTRFALLGWAWRENVAIQIVDSSSATPVADAMVTVAGKRVLTDNQGRATVSAVSLGQYALKVEKVNYQTLELSIAVDVFSSGQNRQLSLVATGRPVGILVTDRLTGKPVPDATITDGKQAKFGRTDKDGRATVVIPTQKKELEISVAAGKYRVLVTKIADKATLQLIPDGVLYFLSKQSGKLDVVKSNLDGSDRKVVVAGTGDENDRTTTLLASRDWKYLVLKSKRAPNKKESLFIIDTATDTMKLLDEGAEEFTPIGWSGHSYLYKVDRGGEPTWRAKRYALKSYAADSGSHKIIDENATANTNSIVQDLINFYILDDLIVYTKYWYFSGGPFNVSDKSSEIISVKPDGTNRKVLKAFDLPSFSFIDSRLYLPQEIYYKVQDRKVADRFIYGEVENGVYKGVPVIDNFYEKDYPTFLMSPNGNVSFWYEERDGKNAIFIGGKNAENKEELSARSEFKPYGWLTDNYLLLQKKDSELYITTKEQFKSGAEPLKVSDYHKLQSSIAGYGYGYGGQ